MNVVAGSAKERWTDNAIQKQAQKREKQYAANVQKQRRKMTVTEASGPTDFGSFAVTHGNIKEYIWWNNDLRQFSYKVEQKYREPKAKTLEDTFQTIYSSENHLVLPEMHHYISPTSVLNVIYNPITFEAYYCVRVNPQTL